MRFGPFYGYIYDCLTSCASLMALLDSVSERGVRRTVQPEKGSFVKCLCFGNKIGNPIGGGFEDEPVAEENVQFIAYVRTDASLTMAGDVYCGEIMHWLRRLFGCGHCPMDCCAPTRPTDLIIMNSRYDGDSYGPEVYDPLQAWRFACRYRFKVVYQCCRPGQPEFIR